MPKPESAYVACLDCKRGPKFRDHDPEGACAAGWQVRTRKGGGCYCGERIDGTAAKPGEQGHETRGR
jgi:hypothetical protein